MIIDVWSDVVCPWCFIGRRRLEKAIANLPLGTEVLVRHRAFQLNPDAQNVVLTKTHLAEKYRISEEQVNQMTAQVCTIADGEGLCYDLDNTLSGNTKDAHRLLLWAESIGKQDELLEALYSSYFEKSIPVFSHEDLIEIAKSVGLDVAEVQALLNSENFSTQVLEDQKLAAQLGANGVPFYVIDMKFGISGAQPQEVFDQTLANALAN